MPTLRTPRWPAGIPFLLMLGTPLPSPAQAPGSDADDLKLPRELLLDAMNASMKPVANFTIPGGTAPWKVSLLRLSEDAFFVNYTIGATPPFQVLAIICSDKTDGAESTRVDATLLAPTETADDFYDANVTFAYFPPDVMPPCSIQFMRYSVQSGTVRHQWDDADREAHITTSPERTVRHMANWTEYLIQYGGDRKRAAQFLAVALDHESDELLKLATGSDFKDAVERLSLLERILPSTLFDPSLPLTAAQSAKVARFLNLRLGLRQKFAAFVEGSGALNQRDRELLRKFGGAQ